MNVPNQYSNPFVQSETQDKMRYQNYFYIYVMGTQKNLSNETVLTSANDFM